MKTMLAVMAIVVVVPFFSTDPICCGGNTVSFTHYSGPVHYLVESGSAYTQTKKNVATEYCHNSSNSRSGSSRSSGSGLSGYWLSTTTIFWHQNIPLSSEDTHTCALVGISEPRTYISTLRGGSNEIGFIHLKNPNLSQL